MLSSVNIAASGMLAAQKSLEASASNVANMQTNAPVPITDALHPFPQTLGAVHQAIGAVQQASPGGGVKSRLMPLLPSYRISYDPTAPYANAQGMVATPNVGLAHQELNQIMASAAFKANLAMFKAANKTLRSTLDKMA